MPVASLRSNQVASNDSMESAKALIGMIDKKVRNLEKRKGKLDSYKQLAADGKELNDDQQAAIENLTSVELNLEFAKDLQKQFNQFVLEQAKFQKKQAKKEEALRQANRRDADLAMIKNVLELQNLLNQLSDEAREDFIKGTNGAVALSEEVLKQIDELYKVITPDDESEVPIDEQIATASRHLAELFAASSKEFQGTTYKNICEAIASINASGYFDQKEESEESDEAAEEEEEEEGVSEEAKDTEDLEETSVVPVVEEVSQPTVEDVQHSEPDVSNGDTTTTVEAPASAPDTQDDLTANEHGLNFLGESEVSSRSRIHADAPPFYPSSSSHVTQQPQTTTYDPEFAPTEASSGWDEPSYESAEPYRAPEESNQRDERGDRDGFRGGRGRGGFRGRGGGGRSGNRGNYSGGNYGGGNYGSGSARGGGQNQRGGGGFRGGNRGSRGNFRGNRGQRGGRGGYQQRDN